MTPRIAMRKLVFAAALALASCAAVAQPLQAPNVVEITPRLVTSGQPNADALARLGALGFEAVIYLAPPTVMDAVKDEPLILGRQGITFVNLPIHFDQPTEADVETLNGLLRALAGKKVLVHCQVNFRASAMVFLYRAIALREDPRAAYESVSRVWTPNRAWRTLIEAQLRKHQVAFELF